MFFLKLLLFLLGFLNFAIIEAYGANYLYKICSTTKTFTANSSYQFNLNTLLYSLSSATTNFYNTSAGSRTINDDTVFGQFMCRGDVPIQVCRDCVQKASQTISLDCRYSKEAIIWYDECLLRYSNSSFFATVSERPSAHYLNNASISNQESYNEKLAKMLVDVVSEASNFSGSQRIKNFATKSDNFSELQSLYSLAQCTPDLSGKDCERCLHDAMGDIPGCCLGNQGGRILCPSCNLRFEIYPFYYSNVTAVTTGKFRMIIRVLLAISLSTILLGFCCYILQKRRKKSKAILLENFGDESGTLESLQFNLDILEAATNRFSQENRIGKGGFGDVYKGILPDGRFIAVKRLSRSSGQGAIEFKNEVLLIAKLQHRNLVALLGFCLKEQEKILVYEYVPNKSLDHFLFDSQKRKVFKWSERYKIIGGIAQGILYLHEHSRLKIIHRDLKPSNILLDDSMNPKISDFGMAKIVDISESEGRTNRIVGTYGYMSPEYAMFGKYSEKSDIFSFGVMILEIISGKRNSNSCESRPDGLLSYAWTLWRDGTPLEILDPNLAELHSPTEVRKCIRIGLLCVQAYPNSRPSMAQVVSYLTSRLEELPLPQEPAFFINSTTELNRVSWESSSGQSANKFVPASINEISVSACFPR